MDEHLVALIDPEPIWDVVCSIHFVVVNRHAERWGVLNTKLVDPILGAITAKGGNDRSVVVNELTNCRALESVIVCGSLCGTFLVYVCPKPSEEFLIALKWILCWLHNVDRRLEVRGHLCRNFVGMPESESCCD
ncbi:hypothetical protein AUR64_04090 [Haloprofundus marisrubri]|uniref:Uncharacterized protein n=1 Tax=Haloprofundus marisrubri TaxID=1514971 RepID=A0A0W1RED2_9EURY|nr:hypothetical protein AUR64_04090 [Haloprofundus marisrubri]